MSLESTRLAEREIADGRLVPLLQDVSSDIRYVWHYLVFPQLAQRRRTLQAFSRWMLGELGLEYNVE